MAAPITDYTLFLSRIRYRDVVPLVTAAAWLIVV